jgi:hypothetical protein
MTKVLLLIQMVKNSQSQSRNRQSDSRVFWGESKRRKLVNLLCLKEFHLTNLIAPSSGKTGKQTP